MRAALADEIRLGRVEGDGNGSVRLVVGALYADVVQTLALFDS